MIESKRGIKYARIVVINTCNVRDQKRLESVTNSLLDRLSSSVNTTNHTH